LDPNWSHPVAAVLWTGAGTTCRLGLRYGLINDSSSAGGQPVGKYTEVWLRQ
jgi:hypothetical protein